VSVLCVFVCQAAIKRLVNLPLRPSQLPKSKGIPNPQPASQPASQPIHMIIKVKLPPAHSAYE